MGLKLSKYWHGLLALSLALVIAGWFSTGLLHGAREVVYPFENAAAWVRRHIGAPVSGVFSRADLAARNRELADAVDRLCLDVARLEAVAAENRQLRAALNFPPSSNTRIVACPVLSQGGSTGWQRQIRVGKGRLAGLQAGDPVLVAEGLVGRIESVMPHTADVLLLSDPNSRVACELDPPPAGTAAVRGVLCGSGGRAAGEGALRLLYVIDPLRLRFLKRDVEVSPQTRVVTSGLGGVFPRGLQVGYLLETTVDPAGLYREALVMPAADLGNLQTVFVLAKVPEARP
jgi:rod shape-determining protein MreC